MTTVRTRFAPSPTGFLHIGSARTALFSWLYAKKCKGQFLLRIEDTDRERSTEEAVQAILDGMEWLGLQSDEPIIYQTQRFARYKEIIDLLLAEKKAYCCDCSKERLETLRTQQMQDKQKPRYDGHCRTKGLDISTPNVVIRFKNPDSGSVVVYDQVYGEVEFQNLELDDLIIARSDGTPTYNFCVVVDDLDMKITHVIRGDDHLNNTPRQINILKALGGVVPVYAHLPLILDEQGKKLSKRTGAVGTSYYRDLGILPEAMRNYLIRLGWSNGNQELFTDTQMQELFDLNAINKAPAALNTDKLLWINQHYLKELPVTRIHQALENYWQKEKIKINEGPKIDDIIELQRARVKTLTELVDKSRYFYEEVKEYDTKASETFFNETGRRILQFVLTALDSLKEWNPEVLDSLIHFLLQQHTLKMPQLAQPLRIALTGNVLSPAIHLTLFFVGKERALARITKAIHFIDEKVLDEKK